MTSYLSFTALEIAEILGDAELKAQFLDLYAHTRTCHYSDCLEAHQRLLRAVQTKLLAQKAAGTGSSRQEGQDKATEVGFTVDGVRLHVEDE